MSWEIKQQTNNKIGFEYCSLNGHQPGKLFFSQIKSIIQLYKCECYTSKPIM